MPERIREVLEEARERIMALESERDDLQDQLTERQQVRTVCYNHDKTEAISGWYLTSRSNCITVKINWMLLGLW